jgi:hypothetical protein
MMAGASVAGAVPSAAAQSVSESLTTLLVSQRTPAVPDTRDQLAALTTRDTLAQLVLVDLSTFPVSSSAGGFVYRFNSSLGTFERASTNFGPFFTERALRTGREQTSVGLSYRHADFTTLQGASLTDGTFPSNAARLAGTQTPFEIDALTMRLSTNTVTGFVTYGVSDRLDIGATVPIVSVDLSGSRINSVNGRATLQSSVSSQATGLGDVALRARYLVAGTGNGGVAVGTDVRLPTGKSEDLLGAGKAALRMFTMGSYEGAYVATHVNVGYTVGGVSREFAYGGAVTFAASPRATLVAELMGRYLSSLHTATDLYLPGSGNSAVETMRWVPTPGGVNQVLSAFGLKWNLAGGYMLNGNILVSLTDSGLTARVVPSITLDYTFAR